jgi:hypothetical protein
LLTGADKLLSYEKAKIFFLARSDFGGSFPVQL